AGLQYGDKILGVNNLRTTDVAKLVTAIGDLQGKPGTIHIERDGAQISKTLQPVIEEVEVRDEKGASKGFKKTSRIGISFLAVASEYKKLPPGEAIKTGVLHATYGARAILDML